MAPKTTSVSGFDVKFGLFAPGFLLEPGLVTIYLHALSDFTLERCHYKAIPRRKISMFSSEFSTEKILYNRIPPIDYFYHYHKTSK